MFSKHWLSVNEDNDPWEETNEMNPMNDASIFCKNSQAVAQAGGSQVEPSVHPH